MNWLTDHKFKMVAAGIFTIAFSTVSPINFANAEDDDQEEVEVEDGEHEGEEGEEGEDSMNLSELPAVVRELVITLVGKNEIEGIESKTVDGQVSYEVDYEVADVDYSLLLTSDGELIAMEKEVSKDRLPAAALAALAMEYGKVTVKEVEEVTVTCFDVEFMANGEKHEMMILANGQPLGDF